MINKKHINQQIKNTETFILLLFLIVIYVIFSLNLLLICYLFCIFVAGNKRLITMSKKKTELSTKEKQPVKIRYKKLANGNLSIYLDIYQNGKRNYKFLKLYLVPETNEKAKAINRKNMDLAEAIKAQ